MPIDAAIVLGAGLCRDGSPSRSMRRRVTTAVDLYRKGVVGRILLSGGPVRHPLPEAEAMCRLALDEGVPAEVLLVEPHSLDTLGNARRCIAIVRDRGWQRVVVVTDGYHLPRALYTFRRLGLPVAGVAATPPRGRGWWPAVAREAAALPVYVLRVEVARLRDRFGRG